MAVYSQWADTLHTATMLGPKTGLIGAGWHSLLQDGVAFGLRAGAFRHWLRRMPPAEDAAPTPVEPAASAA